MTTPKSKIIAFAFDTPDTGYRNQLIGAIDAIHHKADSACPATECLLLPQEIADAKELPPPLCYSNFGGYRKFRTEIFSVLDTWFKRTAEIPRVFLTPYNLTESAFPEVNADTICHAVKEYYKQHNLGEILTVVLSSKLHKYKYVDFINVPKHMLSLSSRIRLLQNKKLRKKVLITVGNIHSFNLKNVEKKKNELEAKLSLPSNEAYMAAHVKKLQNILGKNKKIVICLGGRTEGKEIIFDVNYAQALFEKCFSLVRHQFGIIIVNGTRTPNDVTDYLHEKAKQHPDIIFHNCKHIAQTEKEKAKWRLYSGKFEHEFSLHEQIGNIYPAVLGFGNTLVVHTVDSFSCCETISAGIPTAISAEGIYINKNIRPDIINMFRLMTPKYALNFEDFIKLARYMELEPQNFRPAVLSNPLKVFAEAIMKRIKS